MGNFQDPHYPGFRLGGSAKKIPEKTPVRRRVFRLFWASSGIFSRQPPPPKKRPFSNFFVFAISGVVNEGQAPSLPL